MNQATCGESCGLPPGDPVLSYTSLGSAGSGRMRRSGNCNCWRPTHVRGLLFARAVILCEGPTEVGALPRWWRKADSIGLPDPQAANIPVISVDGDSGFGAYIRYLVCRLLLEKKNADG